MQLHIKLILATSLNNLALLYESQGQYHQAEPLYLQALEICQQVLGDNHPNTITVSKNLAQLRATPIDTPHTQKPGALACFPVKGWFEYYLRLSDENATATR
ncbi:tetratricopeptide repeat protein [Umezakia ovalisporum]|jgi:tetratricopeptide (TPR) repeat protein|uniref:tetratricopeptide repeat protein n=1 Tax=Umezakia ovalisporum TaxID=75695 RepID=UPI0028CB3AF8|nr:tetratricopeptide repeat protein [Umezakia ovalisporum]MBI1240135.1 tetratricopeptide repeat protein [Nostoc sp. RI_552]